MVIKTINEVLKELTHFPNVNEDSEMQLGISRLSNDFAKSIKSFQTLQKETAIKSREAMTKAKVKATFSQSLNETNKLFKKESKAVYQPDDTDNSSDNEHHDDQERMERQELLSLHPQIEINDRIIEERENEIREIESSILQVNDIFKDLSVLVSEQQDNFGKKKNGKNFFFFL